MKPKVTSRASPATRPNHGGYLASRHCGGCRPCRGRPGESADPHGIIPAAGTNRLRNGGQAQSPRSISDRGVVSKPSPRKKPRERNSTLGEEIQREGPYAQNWHYGYSSLPLISRLTTAPNRRYGHAVGGQLRSQSVAFVSTLSRGPSGEWRSAVASRPIQALRYAGARGAVRLRSGRSAAVLPPTTP